MTVSPSTKKKIYFGSLLRDNSLGNQKCNSLGGLSDMQSGLDSDLGDISLTKRIEDILETGSKDCDNYRTHLSQLREILLLEGLPIEASNPTKNNRCSLRGRVWKVLLGVGHYDCSEYLSLVEGGKCKVYHKIRCDTFRTMATDKAYKSRVEEDQLIRLLNSFCRFCNASDDSDSFVDAATRSQNKVFKEKGLSFSYVQGMNVLAAPFLFSMPEIDAFYSFAKLVREYCPTYVQPTLVGVHAGLNILDEILENVDPELYCYLLSKHLKAELYAFPTVMTFSACTPPLVEVLKLWDFLFAYGPHLNIICAVAQFISLRDQILSSDSPMKILRTLPPLKASSIISLTVNIVNQIPSDLYNKLVRHPIQIEK
eukprot:Nk52_evm36s230 gene=Nk52_evmTU36s230